MTTDFTKMQNFSIDLTSVKSMDELQAFMDGVNESMTKYIKELSEELGVSAQCASDVCYLRTRSRHTPELEAELIRLHKNGNPPNINEFPSK